MLGVTKSFRSKSDVEVSYQNSGEYLVKGSFLSKKGTQSVILLYSNNFKKINSSGIVCKSLSEHVGKIPVVSYSPSESAFFYGGSSFRRKYVNAMLCQVSQKYLLVSSKYNKTLKERNYLLKNIKGDVSPKNMLLMETITERLAEEAYEIISTRRQFVQQMNALLKGVYAGLFTENDVVRLQYVPNVDEEKIKNSLRESVQVDIERGATTFGPHRDDYIFIINNNKNIVDHGSQGQQKGALLCAKLSFVEMIKKIKRETPIVLLDDIFSEFDKKRQNNLFKLLDGVEQVIMTTATLSDIDKNILDTANVINLNREENV